jgi:hypothetical protein
MREFRARVPHNLLRIPESTSAHLAGPSRAARPAI